MNAPVIIDRRRLLKGSGALIVSFSLTGAFAQDQGQTAHDHDEPAGDEAVVAVVAAP